MPDSEKTVLSLSEGEVAIVLRANGIEVIMQQDEKEPHENFAMALALMLQHQNFRDIISDWAEEAGLPARRCTPVKGQLFQPKKG